MNQTKKCKECGIVKSLTDYYGNGMGGKRPRCKECENAKTKKVLKPIKCKCCNSEFTPRNYLQKYCSLECSLLYKKTIKKEHKKKKCNYCGKTFISINGNNKYCSKECRDKRNLNQRSKKPKTKICKVCNKEFIPYTSLNNYCSSKCRIINEKNRIRKTSKRLTKEQIKNIIGKNNPAYRNGMYTRKTKRINIGQSLFDRNKKEIKQAMIDDVGYVYCEYCMKSNCSRFESHHIIFRSEMPLHEHLSDKENIVILGIKCHNEFHKHKSMRGYLIKERGLDKLFNSKKLELEKLTYDYQRDNNRNNETLF